MIRSKQELKEALNKKISGNSMWHWSALIASGIIVLGLIVMLWYAKIVQINATDKDKAINYFYFFVGTILSLVSGFVSNIFWIYYLRKVEHKQNELSVDVIKSVGSVDLISSILEDISSYGDNYCRKYSIDATLSKHSPNSMLCSVTYKYYKVLHANSLNFKFIRISTDDQAESDDKNDRHHLENEYYYRSDERSFKDIQINDSDYKLLSLEVRLEDGPAETVPLQLFSDGNTINYHANINPEYLNKDVRLEYTVEYLVEMDSLVTFVFDFPTYDVTCKFNYSPVADVIDFYSYGYINSQQKQSKLHKRGDKHHKYGANGLWVLPKSNYLFVWYKK